MPDYAGPAAVVYGEKGTDVQESRYRDAERQYWSLFRFEPAERLVRLSTTGTQVRVQDVGEGEPVLFIHGGPNSGSTWAPLLEHFRGYRCFLVDRPGTGLSEPYKIDSDNLAMLGSKFVSDILDGLGVERSHVVASSFGGHLALRSAASHPQRFLRMVQMACPAFSPGEQAPPFMKLLTFKPARWLLNQLPPSDRANRNIMRQIGHGASLDSNRIDESFFAWYLALLKYTDTLQNDGEMIARLVPRRARATLSDDVLSSAIVPTLFLWGEDDTFGGEDVARYVTGKMPDARLSLFPGFGHLPWLDNPEGIARATKSFLDRHRAAEDRETARLIAEGVAG